MAQTYTHAIKRVSPSAAGLTQGLRLAGLRSCVVYLWSDLSSTVISRLTRHMVFADRGGGT